MSVKYTSTTYTSKMSNFRKKTITSANETSIDFTLSENEQLFKQLSTKLQSYVRWTDEHAMEDRADCGAGRPLSEALERKVRGCLLAPFVLDFCPGELRDRDRQLLKLEVLRKTLMERLLPDWENDLVDDMLDLAERLVSSGPEGWASYSQLCRELVHLRLIDAKIGRLDEKLARLLPSLEALVLSGNLVTRLELARLPRGLRLLELYRNCLRDLPASKPPPLYHLGLGYNLLSDDSVLSGLPCLRTLVSLDLSDNDFLDLTSLLPALADLPLLTTLALIGNPCSVMAGYVLEVVRELPNLKYLDGQPLEQRLRWVKGLRARSSMESRNKVDMNSALLKIFVFRIMGLPKPANTPGARKFYELQTCFPLLDGKLKSRLLDEILHSESEGTTLDELSEKAQSSLVKSSLNKKPSVEIKEQNDTENQEVETSQEQRVLLRKSKGSIFPQGIYILREFLSQDVPLQGVAYLKSTKIGWSPLIRMKGPIFEIEVPPKDIIFLRDTLRTFIDLKLYYVEEYGKKKEVLELSKQLVAKIRIPAEVVNWNQPHISYSWTAMEPCRAKKCPNIEDIEFVAGKKKRKTSDKYN